MNELTAYQEIVDLYLNNNLYERLIYFLMNNQPGFETNYPKMGTNTVEPNFVVVVEILSSILFCKTIIYYYIIFNF